MQDKRIWPVSIADLLEEPVSLCFGIGQLFEKVGDHVKRFIGQRLYASTFGACSKVSSSMLVAYDALGVGQAHRSRREEYLHG